MPHLRLPLLLSLFLLLLPASARKFTFRMADFDIVPNTKADLTPKLQKALTDIHNQISPSDHVVIKFSAGTYNFHAEHMANYEIYVSNHDQTPTKKVAFMLDGWHNLTIDGGGADFIFHGRLTPFVLSNSEGCTLRNFSVDFEQPQIAQIAVLKNDGKGGLTFKPAPWVDGYVDEHGYFSHRGEGWTARPQSSIAFEKDTRHIVYRTSDCPINTKDVARNADGTFFAPHWNDPRLKVGTQLALRTWYRPCPGIVLSESTNTRLLNVKVHYAEGMALVAQRCTDILLDKFCVSLRGNNDPRYFTSQADATHFSQCRGVITSRRGLYEGMMDDAINVHGIYLEVAERIDNRNLRCRYAHSQCWGFQWGDPGDSIAFVRSATMDNLTYRGCLSGIRPADCKEVKGAKEFILTFTADLPAEIGVGERYGVENLNWCPEVYFSRNIIRNNRARGALFSSPLRTVCEDNLFDHTSGAAIVLCGDCNGWYESGAVRDLVIRRNRFVNSLTSLFQFTNAIISIYPEIPNLEGQQHCFHGGKPESIVIEKNVFETFDTPILYGKSIDGIVYRNNRVIRNNDYPAFHHNQKNILLERCKRMVVEE